MKNIPSTALMAFSSFVAIVAVPLSSNAANRPEAQFGSFEKGFGLGICMGIASSVLTRQHYTIFFKNSHTVIGGDNQVIVEVSCASNDIGKTSVVVAAYSSDSHAAEIARNTVRSIIVGTIGAD
jgi:hypothetical protein